MRRALKYFSAALLLLLLIAGGATSYLVSTTRGARLLLNLVAVQSGVVLQWDTLQGSLLDGIEATGVTGSSGGTTWSLSRLQLQWQPGRLRDGVLFIDLLEASGVAIRSQPVAGEPMTAAMLQARLFGLPLAVEVRQLRIADFSFASGDSSFFFDALGATATLNNDMLEVSALDFRRDTTTVNGAVQLDAALAVSGMLAWQVDQDERDYAGSLDLGGSLQQLDLNHVLSSPVQLTSNGLLQPAMFANEMLRFDLQHEVPVQSLALLNQPDSTFGGSIHTAGTAGGGGFDTQIQLTGSVQNFPVQLDGRINMRADRTLDINIDASSGNNTLSVLGSLGQTLALDWAIQAPALAELLPTLAGSLTGSGQVGGTRASPEIRGTLNGQQLSYEQDGNTFVLDTLALSANYGAQGNDVQLQLGTLRRSGSGGAETLLQSGSAALAGTPAQHDVTASVVAAGGELQMVLSGAYVDQVWSGTLATTRLRSPLYGDWELEEPVNARYELQTFSISRHCWNHQQLQLCLAGERNPERGIDATLTTAGLSLAWLNAATRADDKPQMLQQWQDDAGVYLPEALLATGSVDVELSVDDFRDLRNGSLDLLLSPRDVELQWSPPDTLQPEQAALLRQDLALTVNRSELHLRQGAWNAEVDVDIAREQAGAWVAQGNVSGTGRLGADDAVAASLDFAFDDLTWLETAVPELSATAGTVSGSATVSGARTRPRLQLQMALSRGQFDVVEYGLQIRNVDLTMTTLADDSVRISGSAASGPGEVSVTARIEAPLQPERHVVAAVSSSSFLLIDTAAARTHLNSDLQLDYSPAALALSGEVEMLSAEFDLEDLFRNAREGAVPVSGDVVIVRGAPADNTANETRRIPLALDLVVKAGEAVHVTGYDLDATLTGELSLRQTPGQSLLVYGELGIPVGSYNIYNQQLNAEDGRLMFFGNASNPVLDLRAFRTTESAEVGVWLNGPLSEVRGELYSMPSLPDAEILSLLVTGKSFGQASSQENNALLGAVASLGLRRSEGLTDRVGSTLGLDTLTLGGDSLTDSALGLGKYLTPNLLVRYKVGLFDRQSILGVEYTLNENIRLKVESGVSQSLELSYTIERD